MDENITRTWNAAFLCGPVRQARFLRGCACIMLPWIGVLIYQARGPRGGHLFPRGIAVAWVGLDLLEVARLLATAWFLRRRRIGTSPLAMATATLFLVDALFDNSTATGELSHLISTLSACLLELPMATLLAWISWRALRPGSPEPLIVGFDVAVTDEHDKITAIFGFLSKMPGWPGSMSGAAAAAPDRRLAGGEGRPQRAWAALNPWWGRARPKIHSRADGPGTADSQRESRIATHTRKRHRDRSA